MFEDIVYVSKKEGTMTWQTRNAMDLKRDFVELATRDGTCLRQLCRQFGISPPTGYKWIRRYQESGPEGLVEQSRRPHTSPGKSSPDVERLIIEARERHPAWGGRKLKRWLENQGHHDLPQPSTITGILRRHDLLPPSTRPDGHAWLRFERGTPNELWQMDFKGWIALADGGKCFPLTVLDDHSRFNVLLEACGRETRGEVQPRLERAFGIYGLPQAILCDHGNPWSDACGRFTAFEAWLLRLGVNVLHGRIRHPQTQGKEERFHRTLKAEVLSRTTAWRDLSQCQRDFESWREIYNHERPHEALGNEVPASRHRISNRTMPPVLREAESWYEAGEAIRKVRSKGVINFKNMFWSIGRGLSGQKVVMRPIGERRWEVVYCWKRIGVMDLNEVERKPKGYYEKLLSRSDQPEDDTGSVNNLPEQV